MLISLHFYGLGEETGVLEETPEICGEHAKSTHRADAAINLPGASSFSLFKFCILSVDFIKCLSFNPHPYSI